jgi:hypothetical protein
VLLLLLLLLLRRRLVFTVQSPTPLHVSLQASTIAKQASNDLDAADRATCQGGSHSANQSMQLRYLSLTASLTDTSVASIALAVCKGDSIGCWAGAPWATKRRVPGAPWADLICCTGCTGWSRKPGVGVGGGGVAGWVGGGGCGVGGGRGLRGGWGEGLRGGWGEGLRGRVACGVRHHTQGTCAAGAGVMAQQTWGGVGGGGGAEWAGPGSVQRQTCAHCKLLRMLDVL